MTADNEFDGMSDDDLRRLWKACEFELSVRAHLAPPLCTVMGGPGPPWYASRCSLPNGHEGDHDLGTPEEAAEAFYAACRGIADKQRLVAAEVALRTENP